MPKKILATNAKLTKLPSGWKAKTNDAGKFIVDVPDNMAGMFGGTISSKQLNINGFSLSSYNGTDPVTVTGADGVSESGFHDV